MKAYVWKENGIVEKESDWPTPRFTRDEVRVAVKAEGICTTDIHMVSGKLDFAKPPWVLGHEMSGVIDKLGEDVKGREIGDRVVIDPVVSCGSCKFCLTGKKYLCPTGGELGTNFGSGGYGEYVVVKPSNLYRLPAELSFEEGAMMEPLNCTLGAIDRVRNMVGSHVAVIGGGPAGLLFIQLAKAYGAIKVTLLDLKDEALELGLKLGADRAVNVAKVSFKDYFTENEVDVVVDAAGSAAAVQACFDYVANSGTVVLYGLNGLKTATIASDQIVAKDLTVVTCTSAPLLWDKGIRLVQGGKVNVKDIITQRVLFDEADMIISGIMDGKSSATKTVLCY